MYYNSTINISKGSSKIVLLLLIVFLFSLSGFTQTDSLSIYKPSFEFQFFSKSFIDDFDKSNSELDFQIDRTLLAYNQNLSNKFSLCLAGDSYTKNKDKTFKRTVYLKRAYVSFKNDNLSISAGLLVLEQLKYQRKIWGLRYIDKTFQHKNGYGDNRNSGILFKHKLNNHYKYDIALTSGYSTPGSTSTEKTRLSLGQTFGANNWHFRLFNAITFDTEYENTHSLFVVKEHNKLNIGCETAIILNQNNQVKEDYWGTSVFGNYTIVKNLMCFARYDYNDNLNNTNSKTCMWFGLQYSPFKYLKGSLYYENTDFSNSFVAFGLFLHYI